MTDLYEELGVPRDADEKEIRKAYKRKASKVHPDKNPDDPSATEKFQSLQGAYAVLSNPQRRLQYDLTGKTDDVPDDDQLAADAIVTVMRQVFENGGFEPKNYLSDVRKTVQNSLRGAIAEKGKLEKLTEKFKYLIDKTETHPLVTNGLKSQLFELQHRLEHCKNGERILKRALDMLDDTKYTGEIPEPFTQGWAKYSDSPYITTDPIFKTGPIA